MPGIGELTVDLVARTASFDANLAKAANNLNSHAGRMNRSLASLEKNMNGLRTGAQALAGAFALREVAGATMRALDYAASLGEVSQQVGVTVEQLQVYRYAGTQVNVTQEEMEKGLGKLTVSLGQAAAGAQQQGRVLDALGISVRDASGHVKTAGDVMPELADRLARIQDPAQRAAIEIGLFGRAGQKLDPLLSQGSKGIEEMKRRAEDLGLVLSDDLSTAADETADRIAELRTQLAVNFSRAVAENADSILALANALSMLVIKGIDLVAKYPKIVAALTGMAAGARLGGLPGAIVGGGVGLAGGGILGERARIQQEHDNNDLRYRIGKVNEMKARVQKWIASKNVSALQADVPELIKEQRRLERALAVARAPKGPPVAPASAVENLDLPQYLKAGGGGGGGSSKIDQAVEDAKRLTEEFNKQLSSVQDQIRWDEMRARGLDEQVDIEEAIKRIHEQFPTLDAARLKLLDDQVTAQVKQQHAIERQQKALEDAAEAQRKADEARMERLRKVQELEERIQEAQRDFANNLAEAFGNSLDSALTGDFSLKRLLGDLSGEFRREFIIDPFKRMVSDKIGMPIAERLGVGGDIAKAGIPGMEEFSFSLDRGALAVQGFSAQLDGLFGPAVVANDNLDLLGSNAGASADALGVQTRNLGQMGGSMMRLQSIINALGAGGSGGGLFSSLLSIGSSLLGSGISLGADGAGLLPGGKTVGTGPIYGGTLGGIYANGTDFHPGGWALVGEQGPELTRLPRGSQVFSNRRTQAMLSQLSTRNDNERAGPVFHINVGPGGTERERRETANQAASAVRRAIGTSTRLGY